MAAANPLFQALDAQFSDLKNQNIAVGVSGGADSMALIHSLRQWSDADVHALIVDHGLREESACEAASVYEQVGLPAAVLTWTEKPGSRIQEEARVARYGLMAGYMAEHSLEHLFLAHHMDDQAETFLFRLAKGSGVDGLACMAAQQEQHGVILCRPFLDLCKSDLVSYCDDNGLTTVDDPSNDSDLFARVRLRKSMDVLTQEGLSAERLAVSARRFARARCALEDVTDRAYIHCASEVDLKRIVFNFETLLNQPEEIVLRCVMKGVKALSDQPIRLQRMEALCDDLIHAADFRKRTLAGCVFEVDSNSFVITKM